MLTTIIIILLILWALGYLAPAGYRSWGGNYGYPGIGAIIAVILILALLHVIAV